jgi:hypothetical protein
MENKKGVKRERSPSAKGSPLPDDAKVPPPVPSGSPPPSESPSDVLSHHHCLSLYEQGSASGATPVSGPSSLVVDTSRDEKFTRKLFSDLNRDILRPPGDSKIIIIDDSNDDDDAQEEGTIGIDPMAVPASATDAPAWARIANSDDQGSEQETDGSNDNGHSAGEP